MSTSAFKTCPACQRLWAATFRFCPEDGTPLAEQVADTPRTAVAMVRPKARKSSRILDLPPVTASDTNPSTPAVPPIRYPAEAAQAPPRPDTRRQARPSPTPPERPQPLKRGGAADRIPARPQGNTAMDVPAPNPRTAPTLLFTPAISEEVAQAAKRVIEEKAAASEARPESGKRKKGGFSETEWFLAPIKPEEVDAKTGQVLVDPAKYERNTATPEEKRRRFSLRRDDEE